MTDEPVIESATPAAVEAPAEAVAPAVAAPSKIDLVVEKWFSSTFPGTAIGGETDHWNFLIKAKDALKAKLAAEIPS